MYLEVELLGHFSAFSTNLSDYFLVEGSLVVDSQTAYELISTRCGLANGDKLSFIRMAATGMIFGLSSLPLGPYIL